MVVVVLLSAGCGGGGAGSASDSDGTTTSGAASTGGGDPGGTTEAAPTSSASSTSGASATGSSGEATTGVASTASSSSSSSGAADTGTSTGGESSSGGLSASSSGGSSGESSTGAEACVIADVEDTIDFVYQKSIDLVNINTIQASYYNIAAQEIVFFSFFGQGRRFTLDGTPIADVMAPPEALPKLDGASYDQVNGVALLITQDCRLVEADPVTLQTLKAIQLDTVNFKIGVCAGVAIGVDGDMYVISWQTNEMVKMTRDGQTVLARVDLAALDLLRPDGISLIAGSENFVVLSSAKQQAAILSPKGAIVVAPGKVGQNLPPFEGGAIVNPRREPDGVRQRARVAVRRVRDPVPRLRAEGRRQGRVRMHDPAVAAS